MAGGDESFKEPTRKMKENRVKWDTAAADHEREIRVRRALGAGESSYFSTTGTLSVSLKTEKKKKEEGDRTKMRGRYEDRQRWKRLNFKAEVKAATSEREKGGSHILYWLPCPPHQLSLFHPQPLPCPLPLPHDFLTYFSRKNRVGRKTERKFKKKKHC